MKNKNCALSSSKSAKPDYETGNLLNESAVNASSFNPIFYDGELYRHQRLWSCMRQGRLVIEADVVAVFKDRSRALQFCRENCCHLVRFDSQPYGA